MYTMFNMHVYFFVSTLLMNKVHVINKNCKYLPLNERFQNNERINQENYCIKFLWKIVLKMHVQVM